MEDQKCIELESMRTSSSDGRDEMNLAEFPLCALSHRLPSGVKTLHFEDQIWDQSRNEHITRHLTVTGSDAYGLPTALDDEVLLGLVQLSRQRNFTDRKVPFTRYQLIRLLGWRDDTKTYDRLEESLNRWTGVTLYYRNAWRDKQRKCWVDEKFHVIDNVWLCHRNDSRPDATSGAPTSAFVWNEVLYRSFQAGNLKALDFEFFKGLNSAVAKRLYRFLDKRFFRRHRLEFDLKELGWNHVGLSRSYDAASLKRKLRTGILELEQKGYLHPMGDSERFRKVCSGQWQVLLSKAASRSENPTPPKSVPKGNSIVAALIGRGVALAVAETTVRDHAPEKVRRQMDVFDWLVARKDSKVSRNPPGFLLSAIQNDYAAPAGFISPDEVARIEREHQEQKDQADQRKQEREKAEHKRDQNRHRAIHQFLDSLSPGERDDLEQAAWKSAASLKRSLFSGEGSLAKAAKQAALESHVWRLLNEFAPIVARD